MQEDLYDVIVVGAAEPTPAGEARLAAAIARGHGLPVAAVVRAVAEKNLRLGERMSRDRAEALIQQLKATGALTSIRRALDAGPVQAPIPTPLNGFPALGSPAGATLHGLGALNLPQSARGQSAPSLAPLGAGAGRPSTGNTGTFRAAAPAPGTGSFRVPTAAASGTGSFRVPTPIAAQAAVSLKPLGSLRPESSPSTPAPLPVRQAEVTGNGEVAYENASAISSFALPEAPAGPKDPFSVPDQAESPLELALPAKMSSSLMAADRTRGFSSPQHSLAGASALNTNKIQASPSSSGLDVNDVAGAANTERCPTHGLLFDRRKSSGCRKCFEDKRTASRAPNRAARGMRADGLRANPAKRAFLGLFLALFLGFAPAAYYALVPGANEVERLRAEQAQLSETAGTEDNLQRFDQLDELVQSGRWKAMRNTLIIWVAVSGVVMGAFYKVTS